MKWTQRQPVRAGDVIQMTVCGVSGLYEVLRSADDAMNLRVCDLKLKEQSDG
jgi:hypothetical protein